MLDKSITSSNILLNVLKNYKQDLPKNTSNKKGHKISPFLTKPNTIHRTIAHIRKNMYTSKFIEGNNFNKRKV